MAKELVLLVVIAISFARIGTAQEVEFGSILGGVGATQPAATPKVGLAGSLADVEFEGLKTFAADQIRDALAENIEYQSAARPSAELAEYMDVVERLIRSGYGKAGIAAEVSVSYGTPLVFSIVESEQKLFGQFLSDKDSAIPPELLQRVRCKVSRPWSYHSHDGTKVSDSDPGAWLPGEPTLFTRETIDELMPHLKCCYLDCGMSPRNPPFSLRHHPDENVTDVVLNLQNVKKDIRIASIRIEGLKRHTREQLLELIEVSEGDPLHHKTLQHACDQLKDSHRFWRYYVAVVLPKSHDRYSESKKQCELVITVKEYDALPKLGEPISPIEQSLLNAANWLSNLNTEPDDLVFEYNGENRSATLVVSPSAKSLFLRAKGQFNYGRTPVQLNHTLLVEEGSLSVFDWRLNDSFIWSGTHQPTLDLKMLPSEDDQGKPKGHFKLGLGFGAGADSQPWAFEVNPVTLLRMAHGTRDVELNGDILTVEGDNDKFTFNRETGKLIAAKWKGSDAAVACQAKTTPNAYSQQVANLQIEIESLNERFDQTNPVQSATNFLIDQILAQPAIASNHAAADLLLAAQILLNASEMTASNNRNKEVLAGQEASDRESLPEFELPVTETSDEESPFVDKVRSMLPVVSDGLFKRGSWPWMLLRELSLYGWDSKTKASNSKQFAAELARVAQRSDNGPLFGLAAARLVRKRSKATSSRLASFGLAQLDEGALLVDLSHFVDGDRWAPKMTEALAQLAGELSDDQIRLVARYLPSITLRPVSSLIVRRKRQPDEPPRQAVIEALLDSWRDGWREEVETELKKLATPAAIASGERADLNAR